MSAKTRREKPSRLSVYLLIRVRLQTTDSNPSKYYSSPTQKKSGDIARIFVAPMATLSLEFRRN